MITPISSVHPSDVHQVSHPCSEPKPILRPRLRQSQKAAHSGKDQVTLKSAGQPDHDPDGK